MTPFSLLNFIILVFILIFISISLWPNLNAIIKKFKGQEDVFAAHMDHIMVRYTLSALIVIDEKGIVLGWNRGATKLFGYKKEDMMNNRLYPIIPKRHHERHNALLELYQNTKMFDLSGSLIKTHGIKSDGSEFPIDLHVFLDKTIVDRDLFVIVIRDESGLEKIKTDCTERIERLEEYEMLGNFGGCIWDIHTDQVEMTKGFAALFEEDVDKRITSKQLIDRIHIEDRHRVNEVIAEAAFMGTDYDVTYRIIRRNGQVITLLSKAKAIKHFVEEDKVITAAYMCTIVQI